MAGSFAKGPHAPDPETGWMPATVPGDVHLDLLANKKIPDPFYRDNESRLQWIENESWEYRDTFDVTPSLLARSNVDLVFDGLDGPSQVYVNGDLVLMRNNSFRIWRIPVKSHLHAGKNQLRVVFPSPVKAAAARRRYRSMAAEDQDRTQNLLAQTRLPVWLGLGSDASSPAASGARCASRRGTKPASPTSPFASTT